KTSRSRSSRRTSMRDEVRQVFGIDLVIRLRDLRLMSGLTQTEVAKRSGVGEKTISSFETGDRADAIKLAQLLRLLRVYGIAPAAFFRWRPEHIKRFRAGPRPYRGDAMNAGNPHVPARRSPAFENEGLDYAQLC